MDKPFMNPKDDADLTRAILARTTGSPCARLKDLACDLVDGLLDADQQALAEAHLGHCSGCAAVVAALRESTALLPRMAESDPGPWFAQRVLRATLFRPRPALNVGAFWTRLMHRPRIALEAAYLGAAMGILGFNLPPDQLVRIWHAPAFVQPLDASARRVAGQIVSAEQRTAASVRDIFTPAGGQPASLWKRFFAKLRVWFHRGGTDAANP